MNFCFLHSYLGTFRVGDGNFYVDLFLNSYDYSLNVWLYHHSIGIKSYVFGIPLSRIGCSVPDKLDEVFDLIVSNIGDYIDSYREEFMSDEVSD